MHNGPMLKTLTKLAESYDLSPQHPKAVLDEAAALVADPGIADPGLVDLRHLPFCTIDEVQSKDLDQALFVETTGTGFCIWYAIADAAHFAPVGSATFTEALRRGATYYLPGLVIPMLPKVLSEDLCSLNAQVDRRALVWRMEVHADGAQGKTELIRAQVRSRAKLDYDGVDEMLRTGKWPSLPDGVQTSLEALRGVGLARMQDAEMRDVVRYRRRAIAFGLEPGQGISVWTDLRNEVERYNEQLSLLCNSVGAHMVQGKEGRAPIFRVHPEPPSARLASLRETIQELCAHRGLDASYQWAEQDLSDYLHALPQGPISQAIHRQAMVSNQASTFAAEPGPHHGVGAALYGRFSAPMREVVGVYLHSEILGASGVDPLLRDHVIDASNQARKLQKQLDKAVNLMAIDNLFEHEHRAGAAAMDGTVVGLTRSRVHVQLDEPAVDLKVYAEDLDFALTPSPGLSTAYDGQGKARLNLGDRVGVRATGRDGRRWKLALSAP